MNYLQITNLKITKIEVDNYSFVPLIPQVNYFIMWEKYRNIPTEKECRNTQYWIATEETIVSVFFDNGLIIDYKIKAGYYTDFASVPSCLKGFIDSNNRSIIIPAIIHDINYGTHTIGFKASNHLFNEMMRYYKMNTIKRVLAYKSVCWFGKSRFKASAEEMHRDKKLVKFNYNVEGVK